MCVICLPTRSNNVVLVNKGVGSTNNETEISFRGRDFRVETDTLRNIVKNIGSTRNIDFVKIDIEGTESQVVQAVIDILRMADAISVELHNTMNEVHSALEANEFIFEPLTTIFSIRKLVRNTIFSEIGYLVNMVLSSIKRDPMIWYKLLREQEELEGT
jgi:hypothetical protein